MQEVLVLVQSSLYVITILCASHLLRLSLDGTGSCSSSVQKLQSKCLLQHVSHHSYCRLDADPNSGGSCEVSPRQTYAHHNKQ